VIEAAMAHTLKDKAEAAYARGDLLARRRALMDAWAVHVASQSREVVMMQGEEPA
jgi:hypothetical protein